MMKRFSNFAFNFNLRRYIEEEPLRQLSHALGVEPLLLLTGQQLHTPGGAIVLINGTILGVHRQPETFAANFRLLRRCGRVGGEATAHSLTHFGLPDGRFHTVRFYMANLTV